MKNTENRVSDWILSSHSTYYILYRVMALLTLDDQNSQCLENSNQKKLFWLFSAVWDQIKVTYFRKLDDLYGHRNLCAPAVALGFSVRCETCVLDFPFESFQQKIFNSFRDMRPKTERSCIHSPPPKYSYTFVCFPITVSHSFCSKLLETTHKITQIIN